MKTVTILRKAVFSYLVPVLFVSWAHAEFPVSPSAGQQVAPDVSGTIIVWQDNRNGNQDVYGYDLSTGSEFPICTSSGHQTVPSVSGDIVVWQDGRTDSDGDIYGYNLTTKTEFLIAGGASYDQVRPAVSGNIVVWQDNRNGNHDIFGYDLGANPPKEFPICIVAGTQNSPAVDGNYVVWRDNRQDSDGDIYGYNLTTKTEFLIAGGNSFDQVSPAISGNIVVWQDNRNGTQDIYGYNLSTGTVFPICTSAGNQTSPSISGNFVLWRDDRSDSGGDIYGYDLISQREFVVSEGAEYDQINPAISGDIAVWQDNRSGSQTVYARHYQDACDLRSPDNEAAEDVLLECATLFATGSDLSSCAYNDLYDIWYFYTPTQGGPVLLSTDGSDFDTVLGVYQACGGPEIACNDDYSLDNTQSRISMNVVKGKTYAIRIAGFNGATGFSVLTISRIGCQNRPLSDVSGDCFVDMQDLVILTSEWLRCGMQNPEDCP
jgi:beta propeller repeat protein